MKPLLLILVTGICLFCHSARAQVSISIHANNTISNFNSSWQRGQTVIAAERSVPASKNPWQVLRYTIDSTGRQLVDTTLLVDALANVFDIYYDTASKTASVLAEKDTSAANDPPKTYSFIRRSDPALPEVKAAHFYYAWFDAYGYTGYKDSAKKSYYYKYDGALIDLSIVPALAGLAVDSLWPVNSQGISVLHGAAGYFLFDIQHRQRISEIYPKKMTEFQPGVFVSSRMDDLNTLIVFASGNLLPDSSQRFRRVRSIAGNKPCLEVYSVDSAHYLFHDGVLGSPLADYGRNASDSLMGYPFEDSVLIRTRHKNEDVYVNLSLTSGKIDTVRHKDTSEHIFIYPFHRKQYLALKGDGRLRIWDLGTDEHLLPNSQFQACFRMYYPLDPDKHFVVLTGKDTLLYTSLVNIMPSGGVNSVDPIDRSRVSTMKAYAFRNNTLLIRKKVGGWICFDAYKVCDRGNNLIFEEQKLNTLYYPSAATTFNHIYFLQDLPIPDGDLTDMSRSMLVEARSSTMPTGLNLLRINYSGSTSKFLKRRISSSDKKRSHGR